MIELSKKPGEATLQLVREFDEIGTELAKITPHTDALGGSFDLSTQDRGYGKPATKIEGSFIWYPDGKLAREDGTVCIGGLVVDKTMEDERKQDRDTYRLAYVVDNGIRGRGGGANIHNFSAWDNSAYGFFGSGVNYMGWLSGKIGGLEEVQKYLEVIRETHLLKDAVALSADEIVTA